MSSGNAPLEQDEIPVPNGSELVLSHKSDVKGKVILTTGVSPKSIGAAFVNVVGACEPAQIILTGRNAAKTDVTAKELTDKYPGVKVRTLILDLMSLESVRKAAAEVNAWDDTPQIDVLVHSAGIMGPDWKTSPEGFESQLATNHLGPFLFTNLLMGKILAAPAPRVVVVGSDGHRLNPIRFADYNFRDGETYNKWQAYGQSKTANNLFAISLAEKFGKKNNLVSFCLHPGVVVSNLSANVDWTVEFEIMKAVDLTLGNPHAWWTTFPVVTADQGAANYVYAAFDKKIAEHNGGYIVRCRLADPWTDTLKPWATSSVEAERLWKLSEKLVKQEFQY